MSAKKAKAVKAEVVEEEVKEINPVFYLHDMEIMPVYLVLSNDDLDLIQAKGHDFCFLLINQEIPVDKGTKTIPTMMKMINTDFGYALVAVDYEDLMIKGKARQIARVNLPPIPWQMVQRMETFFRAAFEAHGTESAVMLIYDMDKINSKDSSKGWEFYVPKQENSPVACKYALSEVQEHLEGTNKRAVGTAHSHPEMGAYFSNTDDDDQYDFDGLHITCGWQKGKAAEWHTAMIIGGVEFTYPPEDMFETMPIPNVTYASIKEDVAKVSKQVLAPARSFSYGSTGGWGGTSVASTAPKSTSVNHNAPKIQSPRVTVPETCPKLTENTVIQVLTEDEAKCRFCTAPLTQEAIDHLRCYACSSFLLPSEEMPWQDISAQRSILKLPYSIHIDPDRATADIWLWTRENGKDQFNLVFTSKEEQAKK